MISNPPQQRASYAIAVLVVASVALYREGIVNSLAARKGLDVIGSATTLAEVRHLICTRRPDILVIDAAAPRSFELIQRLRLEAPSARVVAFGIEDCETDILA